MQELVLAGLAKLMWSICVIMGAFFFVRTLQFVSAAPCSAWPCFHPTLACALQLLFFCVSCFL